MSLHFEDGLRQGGSALERGRNYRPDFSRCRTIFDLVGVLEEMARAEDMAISKGWPKPCLSGAGGAKRYFVDELATSLADFGDVNLARRDKGRDAISMEELGAKYGITRDAGFRQALYDATRMMSQSQFEGLLPRIRAIADRPRIREATEHGLRGQRTSAPETDPTTLFTRPARGSAEDLRSREIPVNDERW